MLGITLKNYTKPYQPPMRNLPAPVPSPRFGLRLPSRMPKGASMTPAGDIGERRQREAVAVGGFKDGETVRASSIFTTFRGGK